ncbi:DNA-binding transcriptional LysR family regulator [Azorhizobium sp. AG788]|uniref:LysR family transcriptional regulator n=1 Tax=Azorhizobium sp. AG788 TaxID=2183897 RepID=UPI00105DFA63|nr:LysR family transcriptional regulator [Azorhizobium sp. AG788]TDT88829.1 DNA-binding transcriptional LysR family regulator [Azorhizobium sp. AG788]
MLKLDGVAAFVAVADAGSISEAARRLGLAKSVVSERLAELERLLGARLMQRSTRRLALTEAGTAFLTRGRRLLREAEEAVAEIAEQKSLLAGPLRVSAPVSFGTLHLGRALHPFLAAHPGIELTLELDDRFVDVVADGFDLVIRHGQVHDTRLAARRLATSRRFLVAAPAYLEAHGTPASLDALSAHRAILYANRETDWRFETPSGAVAVRPRPGLRVNNGVMMRGAAVAGLGLALLPTFLCHEELAAGTLEVVDVGVPAEGAQLHAAYPLDRSASAKLRALIEHLRRAFGSPPVWEKGLRLP